MRRKCNFVRPVRRGSRLSHDDVNALFSAVNQNDATASGFAGKGAEVCRFYTTVDIPRFSIFPVLGWVQERLDSLRTCFEVEQFVEGTEYYGHYVGTNGNADIPAESEFWGWIIDATHDFPVTVENYSDSGGFGCGFEDGKWEAVQGRKDLVISGKCPFGDDIYFVRRSLETCCDEPQPDKHIFACLDETLEPNGHASATIWQTDETVEIYAPPIMCDEESIAACTMVFAVWFEQYEHYYAIVRGEHGCNCSCPSEPTSTEPTSNPESSEETSDDECDCRYTSGGQLIGHTEGVAIVSSSYATLAEACADKARIDTSSAYDSLRASSLFGSSAPIIVRDHEDDCKIYLQWAWYTLSEAAGVDTTSELNALKSNNSGEFSETAKIISHKMSQACTDCPGSNANVNGGSPTEVEQSPVENSNGAAETSNGSNEGGNGNTGGGGSGEGNIYANIWYETECVTTGANYTGESSSGAEGGSGGEWVPIVKTQINMYAYVDTSNDPPFNGLTLYHQVGRFNDWGVADTAVDNYFTDNEANIIAWGATLLTCGDGEGNLWAQGYDIPWSTTLLNHDYTNS